MEPLLVTLLIVLFFVVGLLIGVGLTMYFQRRAQGTGSTLGELERTRNELADTRARLSGHEAHTQQLEERLVEAREQSQSNFNVVSMLSPIAQKLEQMQHRVASMEKERSEQFGSLNQQLTHTHHNHQLLQTTTQRLASAMQDNRARGSWGELQLQRVLELSGLQEGVAFRTQVHLAGEDKSDRPDVVIDLPEHRKIVIDAKTVGLIGAGDDHAKSNAAANLRSHVNQLASKRYWNALPESTEFVVLFLPLDSQLADCLNADPSILDDALTKNIVLASPSSLYSILKTVAVTWRQTLMQENAEEILALSQQFYERISVLGGHLESLGKSLNSSVRNYNQVLSSIETRLLPAGRKLAEFELSTTEQKLFGNVQLTESSKEATAAELLQQDSSDV